MKLEEKILALRKKRGLSQEGLAKRLKVTRQAVYKWEAGISRPELDKILLIAQLFNISADTLLDDKINLDMDNIEIEGKDEMEQKEEDSANEQNSLETKEPINKLNSSKKLKVLIPIIVALVIITIVIGSIFIINNFDNNGTQENNSNVNNQNTGNTQLPGGQGTENVSGTNTQVKPELKPDDEICTHVYKLISFIDSSHTKKCEVCNDILEENHNWENGKCTYCDYYPTGYSLELEFEKIEGMDAYALVSLGKNKENHVKIPPTYNGMPVTRINAYAFQGCSRVTEITLPVTIKYIENSALMGAGNQDNNYAYGYCERVKLYYEGTLSQFMQVNCGMHSNTGHTILYINNQRIKDLVIPSDITEIKPNAFNFICFDSVTITSNVTKIGQNAFYFSDIGSLTFEEGIEEISDSAFYYSDGFSQIELPTTLKKIGRFAFHGTDITLLSIPDSVEYLGSSAFALCNSLLNVHMGSGLKYVGSLAFNSCDSLRIISFKADGTWDIYDTNNNKLGEISGEKLSEKPYYYFIWQTPNYIYVKQGYEY